jgi:PD-(D/E)XK endonuclease
VEHPKDIGDRSQLAIMYALVCAGYEALVPFGENTRYDLAIDEGGRLARVQCKTGRLRDGAIRFQTSSSYGHHRNPKAIKRHYLGEVDFFAVFCPETGGIYLIPIGDVPNRSNAYLRVDAPRNNQRERVRFAADYEIGRVRPPMIPIQPGIEQRLAGTI